MNYQQIIDKYYPEDDALRRLLLKHSHQVTDRSLLIASQHPELNADSAFLEEAAMLHDIGIRWCHAPSIFCEGKEPYIRHGLIGAELLRQEGYERHARVCERHTGTGITIEQIERQHLPLPPADYQPVSIEEIIICYADKFYSKSRPDRILTVDQAAQSLEKFGHEGVEKFLSWAEMLE
ncbi:MAG: HDIG domain-containing protein [Prevotella sp.]|nr:HDIG domain-containing protein [Prevotella sp.]